MTTILDCFIIVILGIWLLLSIIAQFNEIKWTQRIRDQDHFKVIPSWTFFAPNPGISDYQILYRDMLFDGQLSNWKEISYRNMSILHSMYSSDKRRRKAIAESCKILLQDANNDPENKSILISIPYLTILTYIMSMPKNRLCENRQFLIARTFGYIQSKQPEILFISHQHKLS